MKAEFDKINAVYKAEISEVNQSPVFKPIEAKIRSLKPTQKKAVLS
jgi:hypothetical protein